MGLKIVAQMQRPYIIHVLTLHQMAVIYAEQGQVDQAIALYNHLKKKKAR